MPRVSKTLSLAFVVAIALACVVTKMAPAVEIGAALRYGRVEHDVTSQFSHIKVRKSGSTRTLIFVRDSGEEVVESMVNLKRPYDLLVDYTQHMFLSYVHCPVQNRVLIVGLGGGAMVHFLKKYDPSTSVDVVEIDPTIVEIADKYFGVKTEGKVNVITANGFQYLSDTPARYDVIYMDAFLKPSADTDGTGVPLALKTSRFYASIQQKLRPGGVVVFNLNPHSGTAQDIAGIAESFRNVYIYRLPGSGFVVVASMADARDSASTITARAKEIDAKFKASFSLERLSRSLSQ